MNDTTSAQYLHPAFLDPSTPKGLLIDGKWVQAASGKTFPSINPATGEVIAHLADADAVDVDRAVAAARRAFDEGPWRKTKPFERQQLLLKLAELVDANFEELATIDTIDMGGPISRTLGNRRRAVGMLRYYAGQATTIQGHTIENSIAGEVFSYTLKEPVGVVAAIVPWNGPLGNSIWKIAPALAAGCTVVLKPSEHACLSPLRLAELVLEAGFPPGVVNVLTGQGAAGASLAAHPGVDKVAFTGSTATGQHIVRASAGNLKRLSLELGGKSPDIVFADADLDEAVPGAAMAVFSNAGQICSAGTRLFVERKVYEEFVQRVADYGKSLKVGNGLDPATQMGPIVCSSQFDKVLGYLDVGQKEGAKALAGGKRLTGGDFDKGFFVPPTVFANVHDDMTIAREEIFGPVISALSFDDIDDLVKRANNTPFGLGSGVWTRDVSKAHRMAGAIRAGTVWVNCYQQMDPAVPFGGYKMSGYGRESGVQHVEEYLNVKAVFIKNA